jgi:hypothetical protein
MPRPRSDATSVFALRLRPATKTALEAAAARNGRSTNTEIGARLEVSLRHEHEHEHEDEDVRRLLRALDQVLTTAGEDAGELAGKFWLSDPWSYGQGCTAVEALLGALCPAGAVEPPAVEPSPELIEQLGSEERARSYLEAVRDRVGIAVVDFLLGRGKGSFYRGAADFRERLGPELTGRAEANWLAARSKANRP